MPKKKKNNSKFQPAPPLTVFVTLAKSHPLLFASGGLINPCPCSFVALVTIRCGNGWKSA